MFTASVDEEQIIARVAALDIGKAEVVCCVRLPALAGGKRRVQEVSTHSTMTKSLIALAERLVELGIERVVMEATSDYWRAPFYLFGPVSWLVAPAGVVGLNVVSGQDLPGAAGQFGLLRLTKPTEATQSASHRALMGERRQAGAPTRCNCPAMEDLESRPYEPIDARLNFKDSGPEHNLSCRGK